MSDEVIDIQQRLDREVLPVQWMSAIQPTINGAWRIKGLLPKTGIVCIYGASGSSKTFLTLDIAAHIAAGMDWADRKTEQGLVVYLTAESPGSLANRVALWRDMRGPGNDVPSAIIPQTINLTSRDDAQLLIEWLTQLEVERGPIALVVIDTLARVMGAGDENKAQDMGRLIAVCDCMRETFSNLVGLVHHSGKNTDAGARGSSALRAGVDTVIEVSGDNGWYRASWEKQRDGAIGFHYEYKLEPHIIGQDEDGEDVTSCLVTELQYVGEKKTKATKISPAQQVALDALHTLLDQSQKIASSAAMDAGAKQMHTVASLEAWRQLCYDRNVSSGDQGAKQKAFKRAVEGLQAKHKVQVYQDEVWLAD